MRFRIGVRARVIPSSRNDRTPRESDMGLFDFFFGSRTPDVRDPDHLRELLFGAAQAGDVKQLTRLCQAHRETILNHFPAWQKVPDAVRANPAAVQRYAHGLITVAQFFAERLGSPVLLE